MKGKKSRPTASQIVHYIRERIAHCIEAEWEDFDTILDDAELRAKWTGKQSDIRIAGEWIEGPLPKWLR